jgi:hypothetical protein
MKQYLASAAVFALVMAAVAVAQDPPPTDPVQPGRVKAIQAQPKAVQVQPVQPGGVGVGATRVTPARMAALEEEFETLEAHRDVKKAIVKAAEVAVRGAEANLDLIGGANTPRAELIRAKIEVDAAKAQLEIRVAELREVEVKIKHAKKRLEDAKAAGVRPLPGVRPVDPKQVDPPPPVANAEELNRKLIILQAALVNKKEAAIRVPVEARHAKEELERMLDVAKRGIVVAPAEIEAAEAKAKETQEKVDKVATELKKLEDEIAVVKAKLKEIEK